MQSRVGLFAQPMATQDKCRSRNHKAYFPPQGVVGAGVRANAALIAWIALGILCHFLWTKVNLNTLGTGWLLLPVFMICSAVVLLLRLTSGTRLHTRRSALPATAVMFYVASRIALDATRPSDLWLFTFGYTNGIALSYLLGNCVRLLVDTTAGGGGLQRYLCCIAFLCYNLWWAASVEADARRQGLFQNLRMLVDNDSYQVSGTLLAALSIVIGATTVRTLSDRGHAPTTARCGLACLLLVVFAVSGRLGQVLGSNAGPVFIAGLGLVLAACLMPEIGQPAHPHQRSRAYAVSTTSRGRLLRVLFGLAIISALSLVTVGLGVAFNWLDVTQYRAFGFEDATLFNSSLRSRLDLLVDNGLVHLNYAPVFGNFFVDRWTTGEGTYVHSLIAVVPHLGLVGSLIVLWLLVSASRQMYADYRRADRRGESVVAPMTFMLAALWAVLFVLSANFFSNATLWLSLGLFAPAVQTSPVNKRAKAVTGPLLHTQHST
jgi:hypothetical protein